MPDKPRDREPEIPRCEKQASSEIAERLKKYKAEIFGNKPILIGGIGWQYGDLIQLLELAERDTRERLAHLAKDIAEEVGGNFADTHRLNVGLNKFIKELERIRGKE